MEHRPEKEYWKQLVNCLQELPKRNHEQMLNIIADYINAASTELKIIRSTR